MVQNTRWRQEVNPVSKQLLQYHIELPFYKTNCITGLARSTYSFLSTTYSITFKWLAIVCCKFKTASSSLEYNRHLMKVKYRICIEVLARNCLGPQFLHEKHLVRKLWSHTISHWSSLPDPVSQMTHKVKEEVAVWNTDYCNTQIFMNNQLPCCQPVAQHIIIQQSPCPATSAHSVMLIYFFKLKN